MSKLHENNETDRLERLRSGDLVLCKSETMVGRLISRWTRTARRDPGYAHCGILWLIDRVPFVMDFTPARGGRFLRLRDFCREYDEGMIDVYRCRDIVAPAAVDAMISLLPRRYSWETIALNILERIFPTWETHNDAEPLDLDRGLTCSSAVAYALETAGRDPCPYLRPASVTPADLGRSPFLEFQFTF